MEEEANADEDQKKADEDFWAAAENNHELSLMLNQTSKDASRARQNIDKPLVSQKENNQHFLIKKRESTSNL